MSQTILDRSGPQPATPPSSTPISAPSSVLPSSSPSAPSITTSPLTDTPAKDTSDRAIVTHHYNPDWLSDEDMIAGFIARQDDFQFLRDELARVRLSGSVQHYMLIGQRGAGKTTMLKRLAVAIRQDPELRDHLVALSFPEELYEVKSLDEFWWSALNALGDELERQGQMAKAETIYALVDDSREGSERSKAGLATLLAQCEKLKRRPVLLIDNLDMLMQRIGTQRRRRSTSPHSPNAWSFREALSTSASPVVIGAAVRLVDFFTGQDQAFYDFFVPKRLGKLSLEEVRRVLLHLAAQQGPDDLEQRLSERPGRIDALYELTGGNPRAVGLIFEVLRQGPGARAVESFERLMDLVTPYYKHRFEDLSEQAQVVVHALGVKKPGAGSGLRFGHTAAEIGSFVSLPTNVVSAQLDGLEREGMVEKSSAHGRMQYRIVEQLFRLWLQMRASRRLRQNVIGLTEYFEALFDDKEILAQLQDAKGLSGARLLMSAASMPALKAMSHGFEARAINCMLEHTRGPNAAFDEAIPQEERSSDTSTRLLMREKLKQCSVSLTKAEADFVAGRIFGLLEEHVALADDLRDVSKGNDALARLKDLHRRETDILKEFGFKDSDLGMLYALRSQGMLPLPQLTAGDASAAVLVAMPSQQEQTRAVIWRLVGTTIIRVFDESGAKEWIDWGKANATNASAQEWAAVARTFRLSDQVEASEQALIIAFEQGESALGWSERGSSLRRLGNADQAALAFRKAIKMTPDQAEYHAALAHLLADDLGQYDEAAVEWRQVVAIKPFRFHGWYMLAIVLIEHLEKYNEGEEALLKAIEIDSECIDAWNRLAWLYGLRLGRQADAERAARKALELDPQNDLSWGILGTVLSSDPGRIEEAAEALRKASTIDPTDVRWWGGFAFAMGQYSQYREEALSALYKAMALETEDLNFLALAADCLDTDFNRPDEAEAVYKQVLSRDPGHHLASVSYARRLARQGRYEDALLVAKLATEHDPANAEKFEVLTPLWRSKTIALKIRDMVMTNDRANESAHLAKLGFSDEEIAFALSTRTIVEQWLAPLLAKMPNPREILADLQSFGFERYARPLVLAFEAAIEQRPQALDDLEPELRRASHILYERLIGTRNRPEGKL